ncbi:HLH-domain-containing protein [Gymnopus androsaceus JB14]|uniref:HLH-domain-containing protein n=1 Tax=Gymnopus androsaceus JB14 TaxID=1447944 RepID=A0A6A4I3Z4_9AGAR|nr:HLH-domain-containing protein [Gymnopus androsaceus JB14]
MKVRKVGRGLPQHLLLAEDDAGVIQLQVPKNGPKKRKENHKEVERRRRENINEGIDELGRIVPDSGGEKSKGATLSRAVQYIHHLQENEVRNIEKWTLEKLLMDQAMGDLQAQLEEMRKLWEQEHYARQRAEQELEAAKGLGTKRPNEDGNEMKQEPTE